MKPIERYKALAIQLTCNAVNSLENLAARELIKQSISTINSQIKAAKAFIGQDLKLVVLPEYFLTGFPMGESFETWMAKACLKIDGEEYQLLGEIAAANQIFLSGNAYELDPNFPNLYFLSLLRSVNLL